MGLTVITTQEFSDTYRRRTDEEIAHLLACREDLVPEAAAALDAEASRRHIAAPAPPTWTRTSESDEQISSLEDYDDYTRLRDRKVIVNGWALRILLGLSVLGLFESRNERVLVLAGEAAFAALLLAIAYGVTLTIRYSLYRCPQCSDRFGLGTKCRSCGFPRCAGTKTETA